MAGMDPNLVNFMVEQLGGEEAIKQQFYHERIVALVRSGISIGEIIKTAEKEGFGDIINGMSIQELSKVLRGTQKDSKASGGRLTKVQVESVKEAVLVYLNTNSWSKKGDIAAAVGVDPVKLNGIIKSLREDGKIKIDGQKANMMYTIAGDRKKRPE